jgi:hypothetical protein
LQMTMAKRVQLVLAACTFSSGSLYNHVAAVMPLTVSLIKIDVSCNGADDGYITANVMGGVPPYTCVALACLICKWLLVVARDAPEHTTRTH